MKTKNFMLTLFLLMFASGCGVSGSDTVSGSTNNGGTDSERSSGSTINVVTAEPVATPWVEQAILLPQSSTHHQGTIEDDAIILSPDISRENNMLVINLDNFWDTKKDVVYIQPNQTFIIRRTSTFKVNVSYDKNSIIPLNPSDIMGSEMLFSIPQEGDFSLVFEYILNHADKNSRANVLIHVEK
jgi:hypothetical protein